MSIFVVRTLCDDDLVVKCPDTWTNRLILFRHLWSSSSKINLRKYIMSEIPFTVGISRWNFVCVPIALGTRTEFQLVILITSTICAIHKFRENILESSQNVSENAPFCNKMCTNMHISATKYCTVGYGTGVSLVVGLMHCGIVNFIYSAPWWQIHG